jgi:hypothetical protein
LIAIDLLHRVTNTTAHNTASYAENSQHLAFLVLNLDQLLSIFSS